MTKWVIWALIVAKPVAKYVENRQARVMTLSHACSVRIWYYMWYVEREAERKAEREAGFSCVGRAARDCFLETW